MSSLLDIVRGFVRTVRSHNGLFRSLLYYYRNDMLKAGSLVGKDEYGNRYYENKSFFLGRDRWVEYADRVGLDYDASQIPPEWHGWIHHTFDEVPLSGPQKRLKWMKHHVENQSGTQGAYVPYDTTRSHIHPWKP
ncbi:hypothetical protein ACOME3_001662 [Neoechinorhynchus agilis]